jgi:TolB-like protein/Flp pilus assembly protein TadD
MKKLFDELRRRNVFRAVALYGVVGWGLAQVSSLMESALALPGWFDAVVVSLLLIGLPLVIVFAWVYEMTPEGLKRTSQVAQGASITSATGRKLDVALLAAVVALIALIAATHFLGGEKARPVEGSPDPVAQRAAAGAPGASEATSPVAGNSIAVLPFVDMSPAKDQEYFSDGISEELLNSLAQVNGLQVAGRTSSFAFKGQNKDLREIGEVLAVANILEGSVRKAGDQVRITAQLIKADDGYHLWSNTYDRELKDIFAVQDEIAEAIVGEISPHLPGAQAAADLKPAARAEIGAYDKFLLAREKMTQDGSKEAYEEARALLDEAIAEDPDYAPALAWRAYAETMLSEADGGVGDTPMEKALPVTKDYADRALAADPQSAEGLFALGSYYGQLTFTEGDKYLDQAIDTLRKAVAIRSNFAQAQNDLAYFLDRRGDRKEAVAILEDVLAHDPGLRDANVTYAFHLVRLGRYDDAEAVIDRWAKLRSDPAEPDRMRAVVLSGRGEKAKAIAIFDRLLRLPNPDPSLTRVAGFARYSIGDAAWLEEKGGRWPAAAAILRGDRKLAVERIENYARARQNPAVALSDYLPVLFGAGEIAKIVEYYETEFGTPDAVMKAAAACACSPAGVAAALQVAGRKDFAPLMEAWKAYSDKERELYGGSQQFALFEAQRALLSGDLASAQRHYGRAIDLGWRDPLFATGAVNQLAPKTEEFAPLRARMTALIDEQRAELGIPPL